MRHAFTFAAFAALLACQSPGGFAGGQEDGTADSGDVDIAEAIGPSETNDVTEEVATSDLGAELPETVSDDVAMDTDGSIDSVADEPTTPEVTTPAVRLLEFNQAIGDDGRGCAALSRCTIFLAYNESRPLELRYTEDGEATSGQSVSFAIDSDANGLGAVDPQAASTDADGIATANVRPKQSITGGFVVKASVAGANIPARYFDVVVGSQGVVVLTVVGSYTGVQPVTHYNVNLYRQSVGAECGDMESLLADGTASVSRDAVLIGVPAFFPDFESLEADGGQGYIVVAYARSLSGEVLAWACAATHVEWGISKTSRLELVDRP